jgi:putative ABC transport system ATP-binding protein
LHYLRKEIGYVSQTLFLFNDTIKNNIIYSLLRRSDGNNNIETWVDFALLDHISNVEELNKRIIEIIKEVGLFEDVINIGLRSKLTSREITESDKAKIVNVRNELAKEISHYKSEYVEFYREDKFLEYCSVFENIVFCPTEAITEKFGSIRDFCKAHLYDYLKVNGLIEKLLAVGLKLASADHMLLEKLHQDKSPLLDCIELSQNEIKDRIKINEKLTALGIDADTKPENIEPALREEILDLVFKHSPGKSKEHVLDDKIRKEILSIRHDIQKHLAEKLDGEIAFFDSKTFNQSLSLMENIIFGNINPSRKKANEDTNNLIRKILKNAGLEGLVIKRGLEFNVGERGARLSGGQRQKIVIARILLKNPSILILDEATAALDAASQARINNLVAEKYKDKTVISIAHRLNIIKDYDEIIVFDKGRIVEKGAFEDLLKIDGLFSKLYQGSN